MVVHFCRDPGSYLFVSRPRTPSTAQEAGHHLAVQGILQAYNTALIDAGVFEQTVLDLNG